MISHKQPFDRPTPEDLRARKIKLAEGGIVFVLVLSTCVYLGIRFAREPLPESSPGIATREAPAAAIVHGGTEPAVTVAPQAPAAAAVGTSAGPSPDNRDILPNVPALVTYDSAERTFHAGRYGEAAEMFAAYCARHPQNAWGRYMHGLSLWKAGSRGEARDALLTALQLQPDHLKSLVNLARVELELDAPEAALAAIERALDIAPQHGEALRVLGRVQHRLGRTDLAIVTYLQALRLQADDPWTLNNLGLIYIERGQFAHALAPLARAQALAPEAAVIRNNLGMALERTGHLGQALAHYEHAARLGSGRGEENYVRLEAVTLPAADPIVDLGALAGAWAAADSAATAVVTVAGSGPSAGSDAKDRGR